MATAAAWSAKSACLLLLFLLFLQLGALPGTDLPALTGLVCGVSRRNASLHRRWLEERLLTAGWFHIPDSIPLIDLEQHTSQRCHATPVGHQQVNRTEIGRTHRCRWERFIWLCCGPALRAPVLQTILFDALHARPGSARSPSQTFRDILLALLPYNSYLLACTTAGWTLQSTYVAASQWYRSTLAHLRSSTGNSFLQ